VSDFDSTYIAKFYLDEPESDAVRRLAESLGQVRCAAIGRVEVAAVFHRKLREDAFDESTFREVAAQFEDDCRQELWTWLPITAAVLAGASAAFTRLPRSVFLRSADALHLVCAQQHDLREIYTSDCHMSGTARYFRLRALTTPIRRR
jgi:predicted nucleic acid-binding protein